MKSVNNKYQELFNCCLHNASSMFVLLNDSLCVEQISPKASTILGWDESKVVDKYIGDVFTDNLTEPFIDISSPLSKQEIATYINSDSKNTMVSWKSIPGEKVSDSKPEFILIIGNVISEKAMSKKNSKNIAIDLQDLEVYPLLDVDKALKSFNQDRSLVHDIYKSMVEDEIPSSLQIIEEARLMKDWDKISELVHRMKGGAMYCGTTKLQHVCIYYEKVTQSGSPEQIAWMLEQVLQICLDTRAKISDWLAGKKEFFK